MSATGGSKSQTGGSGIAPIKSYRSVKSNIGHGSTPPPLAPGQSQGSSPALPRSPSRPPTEATEVTQPGQNSELIDRRVYPHTIVWKKLIKRYMPANLISIALVMAELIFFFWELALLLTSVYIEGDELPWLATYSRIAAVSGLSMGVYYVYRRRWKKVMLGCVILLVGIVLGVFDYIKQSPNHFSMIQTIAALSRLFTLLGAFILLFYTSLNIYIRINEYLILQEKLDAQAKNGSAIRKVKSDSSIRRVVRKDKSAAKSRRTRSKSKGAKSMRAQKSSSGPTITVTKMYKF